MKAHAGRAAMRSLRHASRHMRRNWLLEPVRNRDGKKRTWENASPEHLLFRTLMAPLPADVDIFLQMSTLLIPPEHPPNPLLGCHMQEHLNNPLPSLPSISWTKSKVQTQQSASLAHTQDQQSTICQFARAETIATILHW